MSIQTSVPPLEHPFVSQPNRTLLALAVPVLVSLIAEPLTGLIDTAFVARLGAESLAALGVGTAALSSVFWIFNFLGIGTQTEVAQAVGQQKGERATQFAGLALVLSTVLGVLMIVLGWLAASWLATMLGATAVVHRSAVNYMQIRLFGAPAVLALLTAFGALRGKQDMRTPLWIAVSINALNIVLDALLIVGFGVIPAFGIVGAAWASVIAQWVGAVWAVAAVVQQLGWPTRLPLGEMGRLLKVGGDLFLRTGLLTLFLLLTTRAATQSGAIAGAAHQAIRQVWLFTALGLDALAITAQSLVGFFMGTKWIVQARRVAQVACLWGVGLGVVLGLGMWLGQGIVITALVPITAVSVFTFPWLLAAVVQPINALAFVTDGIHWGTADFRYLRNGMFLATLIGAIGIWLINTDSAQALIWIWAVTAVWIMIRAVIGVIRIWPGIGDSPLIKEE
ncbi:MAG: MATE family efflux transporter [Anaerolineales bacterium]|nr:MATE family efflux transporter [Anaerolineales bacterium]